MVHDQNYTFGGVPLALFDMLATAVTEEDYNTMTSTVITVDHRLLVGTVHTTIETTQNAAAIVAVQVGADADLHRKKDLLVGASRAGK